MIQAGVICDLGTTSIIEDVTLATLGVKHARPPFVSEVKDCNGRLRRRWYFSYAATPVEVQYPSRKFVSVGELRDRFTDAKYQAANPHDPLCQIRVALYRRRDIGDFIKGKIRTLLDVLSHSRENDFQTTNAKLAASLYALGARHMAPMMRPGVRELVLNVESIVLNFDLPTVHSLELSKAAELWQDKTWYRANPEHPLAATRWAMVNFDDTLNLLNAALAHQHVSCRDIDWLVKPVIDPNEGPIIRLPRQLPGENE